MESEEETLFPIANVTRIMKNALPSNANIAKNAKILTQEAVSEFTAFVTSEAVDKCILEKRKTITSEDILWAMKQLGFDNYHDALTNYLITYRQGKLQAFEENELPSNQ